MAAVIIILMIIGAMGGFAVLEGLLLIVLGLFELGRIVLGGPMENPCDDPSENS